MNRMNSIIEHQNDQSILDKLSAQRNVYSIAKRWRNVRFVSCVLAILILSIFRAFFVDSRTIAIILESVVFVSLFLGSVFTKQISRYRTLAARIQQLLDTELFGIPWDENLCGPKPTSEEVFDYKSSKISSKFYDWYLKEIGEVQDHNTAVLLCQRESLRYDSHIRTTFTSLCKVFGYILCGGLLVVAFCLYKYDWLSIVTFGLIPITPVIRWIQAVRNDDEQDKDIRDTLESQIKEEMENALEGKPVRLSALRQIQCRMFIHRKDGYLIPNCFYDICRKKSEVRAAYSVREFLAKSAGERV